MLHRIVTRVIPPWTISGVYPKKIAFRSNIIECGDVGHSVFPSVSPSALITLPSHEKEMQSQWKHVRHLQLHEGSC